MQRFNGLEDYQATLGWGLDERAVHPRNCTNRKANRGCCTGRTELEKLLEKLLEK